MATRYKLYANTTDGISPPEAPERGNELTSSLDTAPHFLKSQNIKYDGKGSEREEFTEADKTLPYYPLVKDATDINVFSTGDAIYDDRNMDSIIEGAKSNATPMYPYNKATRTESGHVVEIDDTRDNERLSIEHRTGTFYEIDKDGNEIHRVVNDNYTVICKDNELFVGGKVNIKVLGDATLDIGGDLKADVKGKTDITGSESITVISPLIDLNGTEIKLNS